MYNLLHETVLCTIYYMLQHYVQSIIQVFTMVALYDLFFFTQDAFQIKMSEQYDQVQYI